MSLRCPRARHAAAVAAAAREWPSRAAPASPAAHAASAVRANGHFTAHSAAFGLAPGWFAATAEAASGVAAAVLRRGGAGILASSAEDLTAFPDLFRAGLDLALLDAASAYFGGAAAYDGPLLFITPPDGAEGGTRMWHRDEEDVSVLKVALYLGEVGPAGGPLEVAPVLPPVARGVAGYPAYRDAEMSRILATAGAARPVAMPGPAGTLAFAETGLLYHRGVPPADGARRAVYFSYFAMPSPWPWACRRPRLARAAIGTHVGGHDAPAAGGRAVGRPGGAACVAGAAHAALRCEAHGGRGVSAGGQGGIRTHVTR